jgi:hypothetical protein
MVTGSVRVDLSVEPDLCGTADKHALAPLDDVPDGAHVVVDVGDRRYVPLDAATWLRRNAHWLNLEIQGTPSADIRAWVDAARGGRLCDVVA